MSFRRFSLFLLVLTALSGATARAMPPELRNIVANVAQRASIGETPVVVSDLDETLVDSSTRRFYSIRQAMNEACGQARDGDCGKVAGLNLGEILASPNRYDQDALFDRLDISRGEWRKKLLGRMVEIYLSGKFLELDQAVPGSVEFIQALRESRASVIFVSSRYEDTQLQGTLRSLEDLGFLDPRSGEDVSEHVLLRPRGMDSLTFKKWSFDRIRDWASRTPATVSLVMENEPENMNAMREAFPSAASVFVEGAYLKPEPLSAGPIQIRDFR